MNAFTPVADCVRVCVCVIETPVLYKYPEVWLIRLCVKGWIYINLYLRLYSFYKPLWLYDITGAVEPGATEAYEEHRNNWRFSTVKKELLL